MKPERWEQIDNLLQSALARVPRERSAFLAQACADDELLCSEVESLIASHQDASNFLETPMSQIAADLLINGQAGLAAGQRIGQYKIVGSLGTGAMGVVYLAEDTRLGRMIALKVLPDYFISNPNRLRRFEQEARAASSLNHPNIVTVYEIGEANGHHYIASEFIDGMTLRDRMTAAQTAPDRSSVSSTQLKLSETFDLAIQIGEALAAAHEAGIIHRDIKPENIMVRRDAYVKILDFGLAKLTERPEFAVDTEGATRALLKTDPGIVMGTVTYMSPEQARGLSVDARTDVWSLGVVLYEMATGHLPFEGETATDVILSIVEREPPPLTRYSKDAPVALERIVSKALRKNKDERYQTAKDLALDLKNLKQELDVKKRLERSIPASSSGNAMQSSAQETVGTSRATASQAGALPTSSADYLINEIQRHNLTAALAAAAMIMLVGTVAYFYITGRNNPVASSGEAIDSVAVLPFVNVNSDPNTEYLSDGISDSIINSLSRLPTLKVMSLNSVLHYKGKPIDSQVVGRELKVRAVLISRLTQRGDALAITTELVDVRDNRRLWGAQYNRKLSDILIVQDEIAREISENLRLRLSAQDKKQLAKHYTENIEAYRLYSLGKYGSLGNEGKERLEKSIGYFEQAIKIDPNYALAYVGLSGAYHQLGFRGFWIPKEAWQKAEWAALKAVELDDTLAEAHVALGIEKLHRDWAGTEKELKRALELDPNSGEVHRAYALYLAYSRRPDEAVVYAKRGEELDSSNPGGLTAVPKLPFIYFLAHAYDTAIEGYLKALEKNPNNAHFHFFLGEAYVAKGMYQEGVAEMQKAVALDNAPQRWDRYPVLAYAYALSGKHDKAQKILNEQKKLAKQRYISPYNFAIIYTGLGDRDRAFEYLNRAADEDVYVMNQFPTQPMFDSLRSDPRYKELLRRMNRAP